MSIAVRQAAGATFAGSVAAPHRGVLWAALTVLIWAAYPVVTRLGVTQTLAPGDLFALRFGISALLFLPYLLWRASALLGGAWVKGIGLAACQGTLAGLVIVGLAFAPASHASALVQGVVPAWLLVVGALFLGQRFGRRAGWTVALIAAGAAAMVLGSTALDEQMLRGNALFLLASLLACGYILQARHYRLSATAAAAFVALYSAVAFLPWYFLSGGHSFAQASAAELVLQTVYQGVLIGCVSFIALNRAIAGLGCLRTGAFISAVPVLTAIIAVPVLGEYPSLVDCAALVLITLGIALAARAPRKEDPIAGSVTNLTAERTRLETELRLALARKEVDVHFQPQVVLASGRIVGVEALARWRHRDAGWIPPARFIPVAEESSLIHPLGELVLARACRQIREWDRAGLPPLRVAVNVSARQLGSLGFVRAVRSALRVAGLNASRMQLEVPHAALVQSRDRAVALLTQLKGLGVRVAIDDFGADRPGAGELRGWPVDCVKLHRKFVARVADVGEDMAVALGVISLAQGLDLSVIAEGVETGEQLEFLREHGCDEGQGELLCAPLPAESLGAVLAAGRVSVEPEVS